MSHVSIKILLFMNMNIGKCHAYTYIHAYIHTRRTNIHTHMHIRTLHACSRTCVNAWMTRGSARYLTWLPFLNAFGNSPRNEFLNCLALFATQRLTQQSCGRRFAADEIKCEGSFAEWWAFVFLSLEGGGWLCNEWFSQNGSQKNGGCSSDWHPRLYCTYTII